MHPFVMNGDLWRVIRVPASDPRLVDRTGYARLATTDPITFTIALDGSIEPPMLDKVLMHEISHAATISYGLLGTLRKSVMERDVVGVEEWAAQFMENHSIEVTKAASAVLGRPVCIGGHCD